MLNGKKQFKERILIVDDSSLNLRVLEEELGQEYEIQVAANGEEALSLAGGCRPPDLILLDVMLPGVDGYEVCRRLKEGPETRDIPVLFVTSRDTDQDEEYGLSMGAIDYVKKPFSIPVIRVKIRNHLELKRYRDLLQDLSMLDGMTGIPNRRHFDEILQREYNRAVRTARPLSVLFIDIDHFKAYNDELGHLAGDQCLQEVASTLGGELRRPGDFLARWGGEEFACVLPETDTSGAYNVAQRMRRAVLGLDIRYGNEPDSQQISISVGTATLTPEDTVHPGVLGLFSRADEALYLAKENGRNRVEVGQPGDWKDGQK